MTNDRGGSRSEIFVVGISAFVCLVLFLNIVLQDERTEARDDDLDLLARRFINGNGNMLEESRRSRRCGIMKR